MPSGFAGIADDAHATAPPPPPRGWYENPADASQWRFWSGRAWTEHRHARDPRQTVEFVPEGGTLPVAAGFADDLRGRIPAQSVIEKLIDLEHRGLRSEQRSWHTGAIGERYVADLLARLGPEWTVLHSVPVGTDGSDIDHVVIGPPGVFTINTKHHPGGRVWVAGYGLRVNNHPEHYLSNAAHEASRAARLLSKASGIAVEVVGVIAVVGASVTVKAPPRSETAQIGVIPATSLLQTLQVRRAYSDEQVARIVAAAARPETWSPVRARHTDSTELLAAFAGIDARIRTEGAAGKRKTPSTEPARTANRKRASCGSVLLRLLAMVALFIALWWFLTTVVPILLQSAFE